MGARFDRLRCEVFQNLFLSPMNTGFVRPAVATVLTACGIETKICQFVHLLLKVATVLTACGIETFNPVSYTHLDVYKRQSLDTIGRYDGAIR